MVTVITKTIGPSGDYADFATAENNLATIANDNFGSTDLVASDGAIVFEAVAGSYGGVTFSSGLTSDATRNVTYKPAAGSEHGGDKAAGVIVTSTSYALDFQDDYTQVRGIVASSTNFYATVMRGNGVLLSGCIIDGTGASSHGVLATASGTALAPMRIENCVCQSLAQSALYTSAPSDTYVEIVNTTSIVGAGSGPRFASSSQAV